MPVPKHWLLGCLHPRGLIVVCFRGELYAYLRNEQITTLVILIIFSSALLLPLGYK